MTEKKPVRTRKLEADFRKSIREFKISLSRFMQRTNIFAAVGAVAVEAPEFFEAVSQLGNALQSGPLQGIFMAGVKPAQQAHGIVSSPLPPTPTAPPAPFEPVEADTVSVESLARIELHEDDRIAHIIYEVVCKATAELGGHNWNSVQYQAPETPSGHGARRAQLAANLIRATVAGIPAV